MGDLIDLEEYQERRNAARRTVKRLREIRTELHDLAVAAALEGPLGEWAEAQAIGTIVRFDDECLEQTGGPTAVALVHARRSLAVVIENLSKENL